MLAYAAVRDPQRDRHAVAARARRHRRDDDRRHARSGALAAAAGARHDRRASTIAHGFGKTIVLAVEHVRVVITEGPAMVMRPSFYTEVGLDPWRADIVMVKNFFPFLMFFLPYNRKTIFVRTQRHDRLRRRVRARSSTGRSIRATGRRLARARCASSWGRAVDRRVTSELAIAL